MNKFKPIKTLGLIAVIIVVAFSLFACIDFSLLGGESQGGDQDHGGISGPSFSIDTKINVSEVVPVNDSSLADMIERVNDSVVELNVKLKDGKSSAGSGVIVGFSDNGAGKDNHAYIITCQHVLEDASAGGITVILTNGKKLIADYLGGVADRDIAVIKVKYEAGMVKADFRKVSEAPLRLGEEVVAIGNPLGTLGGTITRGIVSGLARSIRIDGTTMTLLQTDASINSGNSGGALFDYSGTLVGIVNAKVVGTNVEGLGFAIPIGDTPNEDGSVVVGARKIFQDITDTANDPSNPYGGLGYIPGKFMLGITTTTARTPSGVETYTVVDINPYGSLAGRVSKGDILVSLDGKTFSTTHTLSDAMKTLKIGDSVEFGVRKGNNTSPVAVTIRQFVYGFVYP
ncbi:MAG: trypsin-like peptidase domain-containing protein [Firmicutes bacterium]|nr:trypsin-like peptidase domain-containing protein [Bacillota bacterium]